MPTAWWRTAMMRSKWRENFSCRFPQARRRLARWLGGFAVVFGGGRQAGQKFDQEPDFVMGKIAQQFIPQTDYPGHQAGNQGAASRRQFQHHLAAVAFAALAADQAAFFQLV